MWLASTRSNEERPFTLRRDFSSLKPKKINFLKKLSYLFIKTPHLMRVEYFDAPYILYGKNKHYDLEFYSSFKGISAFSTFIKRKEQKPPDDQVKYLLNSFKFITKFCIEKNIRLNEYPFYKSIAQHDFLKHIKDHYISIYTIFCFPEMYSIISNLDGDIYKLFFGDIDIIKYQKQYENSKNITEFCNLMKLKILKAIDDKLKK